jgi:ABC-type phosphate transport system substrate-binding protein
MKKIAIVLAVMIATMIIAQEAKSYKIIVNDSNPINSISKKDLAKIFLKKLTKWDNGSTILPVDQVETATVREAFSKDVLKKTIAATKAYWQEQIFSGRGVPPPEKASDKEVIDYVKANPGAIGYVSQNATIPSSGVKVIEVVD